MQFEYNGNLLFEERINQVADEIRKKYPEIKKEQARLIATLESPITTEKNDEMIFRRYYNILFMSQNKKDLECKIFSDMLEEYQGIIKKNPKIDNLMILLADHFSKGKEFPTFE